MGQKYYDCHKFFGDSDDVSSGIFLWENKLICDFNFWNHIQKDKHRDFYLFETKTFHWRGLHSLLDYGCFLFSPPCNICIVQLCFISREINAVLTVCNLLIRPHIEYCTQAWDPMSRHGNCNVKIKGHAKKSDKNNRKCKRLQIKEEIREIRINYLIRKKSEKWSNWNFQNN